jgi:hypothetical protein
MDTETIVPVQATSGLRSGENGTALLVKGIIPEDESEISFERMNVNLDLDVEEVYRPAIRT